MLSYQHAYHAGGPADLHKHLALAALVAFLIRKPRPVSYLESHAGRGVYDLAGAEAEKTGEAARGIALLAEGEGPFWQGLSRTRALHGPTAYPGSPMIARALLRAEDRLQLCELHPAEHAALKKALAGPGVSIHARDGHEGLMALCPPKPRRGLALIDPSYEVKDEYARTAATALAVMRRWPEGVAMVWYPILPDARHVLMVRRLAEARLPGTLRHEVAFRDPPARGMTGSGLVFLNLPYGARQELEAAWADGAPVFAA